MADRNTTFVRSLIAALAASGVEHACVTPGSRNAPLSVALADSNIHDWSHHDERSAAFFALGIAKTTGRPVLVVTTSGTAAVELHPALVEASASQTPLIALTADRPTDLYDIGAPQTIDQRDLFGTTVRWAHDLDVPEPADFGPTHVAALGARLVSESLGTPAGPVHLNIRFREPLMIESGPVAEVPVPQVTRHRLVPDPGDISDLVTRITGRSGLIVAGPMTDRSGSAAVANLGASLGWPIMSDPISGLRSGGHSTTAVVGSDLLAAADWLRKAPPEVVIRIGAPPTSKALRTWLGQHPQTPQILIAPSGWPDPMASAEVVLRCDIEAAAAGLSEAAPAPQDWLARWKHADGIATTAATAAIQTTDFPSEPGVAAALGDALPADSMLWAASSMPIRDVDSFYPVSERTVAIHGNRGANGIDGFISTALGAASGGRPTTSLVGDLSMLHDVGALATAGRHPIPLTMIVINNDGGGIFHFLPQSGHQHFERHFGTPHGLSFAPVAASLGVDSVTVDDREGFAQALRAQSEEPRLIEVMTNREANVTIHRLIADEVRAALDS